MKLVRATFVAASLLALGACGGGTEENVVANNVTDELYNVAPDDLGTDNLVGNEIGNDVGDNSLVNTTGNAATSDATSNGY